MIQQISQQISLSIKSKEQNLEFKQYPRVGGHLEFEQDSRQYIYLKEYQFK